MHRQRAVPSSTTAKATNRSSKCNRQEYQRTANRNTVDNKTVKIERTEATNKNNATLARRRSHHYPPGRTCRSQHTQTAQLTIVLNLANFKR